MVQRLVERPQYMSFLEKFRDNTDYIKVLTGVRRCGKSTLLEMFSGKLKNSGVKDDEMLRINFESSNFLGLTNHSQLDEYLRDKVPVKGRFYIFLDEIQRVRDWEKTVNALMVDTEADIYITGSNAHILSSDLSTYLTGRYVEVKMLPLSFLEYEVLRGNGRSRAETFREFCEYGGFPGVNTSLGDAAVSAMLTDLYSSIVYRDIVSRGNVRKPEELGKLITYLLLNIGNQISSFNVSKDLHMNVRTVDKYLSIVEDACLFYRADRYDLRSTVFSPNPKYYVVDQGLRNIVVGMASRDRVLENMVYLELRRRGYSVIVGKWDSREVDFVINKDGRQEYWQVSLGYGDDESEKRELAPLRAIKDNNRKTVVILEGSHSGYTKDGIRELSALDFFSGVDLVVSGEIII